MSVVRLCCKIRPYKDQKTQLQKPARHDSKDMIGTRTTVGLSANSNEKQLKSLTCYLEKLQLDNKIMKHSSMEKLDDRKDSQVLENHLHKPVHKKDTDYSKEEKKRPLFGGEYPKVQDKMKSRSLYARHGSLKSSRKLEQEEYDTSSNLYLIGVLASINIAVMLFEIASPVKSSELEISAIPIVYGAKVNHLIIIGQWWRLVTPMFLHSGAFDIGLSCWSLWTFGPKVCKGYGWFTFLLIYFLGGISSNLISFLHTPQLTVGGTGPSYAIIGAWLTYQLQNKDVIPKDVSETMFEKAVVATGLGLILTHFCPIDEWAHFGAVFTGVAYGFLSHPTLQEDEFASTTQPYDPLKSLFVFGFFVLVLTFLFILVEPPLNDQVVQSFL